MTINDELFDFIYASPTAFHAVSTVQEILEKQGYEKKNCVVVRIAPPCRTYCTGGDNKCE